MGRNSFGLGCVMGCVFPAAAFLLTAVMHLPALAAKPLGAYAVAALFNLAIMRYLYRNGREKTGQGIIFITFAAVLILLITKNITI